MLPKAYVKQSVRQKYRLNIQILKSQALPGFFNLFALFITLKPCLVLQKQLVNPLLLRMLSIPMLLDPQELHVEVGCLDRDLI